MMAMLSMFARCSSVCGMTEYMPRTLSRTRTPSFAASYNSPIISGSVKLLSFRSISARRPLCAFVVSTSMSRFISRRNPKGDATRCLKAGTR